MEQQLANPHPPSEPCDLHVGFHDYICPHKLLVAQITGPRKMRRRSLVRWHNDTIQDKNWETGEESCPSASWASLEHSLPLHALVRVRLQMTSHFISFNPQVSAKSCELSHSIGRMKDSLAAFDSEPGLESG